MLEVGIRVVRGPDWKWGNQDGGEGYTGTVVEVGKPPSSSSPGSIDKTPEKTAIVQWDQNARSNYRVGYQDAYDLCIYDNAPTGIIHPNLTCDGCKMSGINGIRWKCARCFDFDLCTKCYMADIHDLGHPFLRFLTSNSVGVEVCPRDECTKIELKGIFVGSKVKRGPDWEWGNQDGGRGKVGIVMQVRGWDNEHSRSVVSVTWPMGNSNVYRVGYKGCVDLCLVEDGSSSSYYKEHLPILGYPVQTIVPEGSRTPNFVNMPANTFVVGEKVKVSVDLSTLKEMQRLHGGWNPRMGDFIREVGKVHRITDKGDIRVQYEGCNNRWTFHPGALAKMTDTFSVGDTVKVLSDVNAVKEYQIGHGEWADVMKSALGKTGKIITIYPDGDIRVAFGAQSWTFNPRSVSLYQQVRKPKPSTSQAASNSNEAVDNEVEKLLRDAARGEASIEALEEFLKKFPEKVDARAGGADGCKKTCLQIVSHQGQRELCSALLNAGASVNATDDDGDYPLHYAAFGNQPAIMELLLRHKAPINAVNKGGCTSLHVAVNKQHADCVSTLLKNSCDVNLQDSYGDTALHDAIGKEALEIVTALCRVENIDFTLQNKRGFNVLHHAALKGNAHATKLLVSRSPQLVDIKKEDSFAALHLAALNGHREVAATLLSATGGRATVDLRNNRQQTPLHLATSQFHWALVELLVSYNADVGAKDEEGETPLHVALTKNKNVNIGATLPENPRDAPKINAIWTELSVRVPRPSFMMACFLVSVDKTGMILEYDRNRSGQTPLDKLLSDPDCTPAAVEILMSYKYHKRRELMDLFPATSEESSLPSEFSEEPASSAEDSRAESIESCTECRRLNSHDGRFVPGENSKALLCPNCKHLSKKSKANREKKESNDVKSEEDEEKKRKEADKILARVNYLENRLAEVEEVNICSICMERRRNVAFLCGHGACDHCAKPLSTCHMCRSVIVQKINLY